MEKLSKNRGVISVFLLVIFVVTYVAMGMLVDAARYRMSRTYAEAALDMATESILASYDNMLFELYGLFGADVEMDGKNVEEALKDAYEKYLNSVFEALSIEADSDTTELVRLLSDSLFEDEDNHYLTARQIYRFEIEELDAGTSVTLANTANVESQIIEYMKFRAPVEIVEGLAGGFLEKLNGLLQFKDRIAAAHEAEKLSEEFEKGSAPKEAKELLGEINAFANRLYDFSTTSGKNYDQLSSAKKEERGNPSNVWTVYQQFDGNVGKAEKEYNKAVQEINEEFHERLKEWLKEAQEEYAAEIILEDSYKKKGAMTEKTNVFQEINIDGITNGDEIEKLAKDVSEKLGGRFSTDYGNYCRDRDSKIKGAGETRNTALDTALDNFKNVFLYREEAAGKLYQDSLALEEKIMELTEEYKAQIETIKAAFYEKPDNEHYKTVFLPKIELLEANAAEIIKNLDLLNSCRPYLKEWSEGFYENKYKASEWLFCEASQIIDAHKASESEVTGNSIASLCTRLKKAERFYETHKEGYSENSVYHLEDNEFHPNTYDDAAVALTETITEYLCVLYSHASYFQKNYYHEDVDVKDTVTQQEEGKGKAEEEQNKTKPDKSGVDKEEIRDNPDWLTKIVPQSEMGGDFSEFSYDGSGLQVMKTGLDLFDKIAGFLEGLRDNLYVDAYVMTHFPNYAEHYVKPDSEEAKEFLGTYGGYCASLAEVEYIISGIMGDVGEGFGSKSVSSVQGKLFCIRMLFNTLAIFTDSAKLQQAMVLAAPAGPFASLVAAALLAVWAAAESGIDVTRLVNGEEVPVFKQGHQWFFSVGETFKKSVKMILGMALGKAEDIATDYMNLVIDGIETNLNRMIYEAYTSESHGGASIQQIVNRGLGIADEGLAAAQENALEYGKQFCENIQNLKGEDGRSLVGDDVKKQVSDVGKKYEEEVRAVGGQLKGYLENLKSGADKIEDNILNMRAASRIAVEAKKAARNTLGTITTKLGNDAAETISEHLSKVIPVGQVQNTGGFDDSKTIKFSYTDYLWFFLVIMNQETKVQRIQEMIQVNMRYYYVSQGKTSNPVGDFALERIPVAVWADLDYSIRLFFLSNGIVPEEFRVRDKDGNESGRLKQRVISAQSY